MRRTKLLFLLGVLIALLFFINLFLLSLFIPDKNIQNNVIINNMGNIKNDSSISVSKQMALTLSEVSKHNTIDDCWMVIDNKVYDITPYTSSHPGGKQEIERGCGIDATGLYDTRGGEGSHSSTARSLLSNYYLGDLNQEVLVDDIKNKTEEFRNTTIQSRNNFYDDDDEYEDEWEDEYEDDD